MTLVGGSATYDRKGPLPLPIWMAVWPAWPLQSDSTAETPSSSSSLAAAVATRRPPHSDHCDRRLQNEGGQKSANAQCVSRRVKERSHGAGAFILPLPHPFLALNEIV